jgi:hypothetical protein
MRAALLPAGASLVCGLVACAVAAAAGADSPRAVLAGLLTLGAARAIAAAWGLRQPAERSLRTILAHVGGALLAAGCAALAAPAALRAEWLTAALHGFRAYAIVAGIGLAALALWEGMARPEPAPPQPAETMRTRWAGRVALLCVLGTGLGVNALHMEAHPMTAPSSHHSFILSPRLAHYLMGWNHRRVVADAPPQLAVSGVYYTLPVYDPLPWTDPGALLGELQEGGRLSQLLGRCDDNYSTCMPHFYAFTGAVAVLAAGHGLVPLLVPTACFLVLIAAVADIGRAAGGRWAGVTAAAVGVGFPGLFGIARWAESYIAEAALSTVMVACLVRSRGLTRWPPLVAFAGCALVAIRLGEGFSESVGAGLAVGGPFLVTAGVGLADAARTRRAPWAWAGGLVLVLGLVAATTDWTWVFDSLKQIQRGIDEEDMAASWRSPNASPAARTFIRHGLYLWFLVNDYVRPPLLVPVVLGLLGVLTLPGVRLRDRLLLVGWFVVPFVGFSFMLRKAVWYPIPMLPPLAVLAGVGLSRLPWPRGRAVALSAAGLLGVHQLVSLSLPTLGIGFPTRWVRPFDPQSVKVRWVDLVGLSDDRADRLTRDARPLLRALNSSHPPGAALTWVAVYTPWGTDPLSAQRLGHYLTLSRPDLVVVELAVARHLEAPAYAGLRAETFDYLVCIGENGAFTDCATELDRAARPDTPPALPRFTRQLLDRSAHRLDGAPLVHRLAEPGSP